MPLNRRNKRLQNKLSLLTLTLLVLTASLAYAVNRCYYHFPGNNYFPPNSGSLGLYLCLIYLGSRVQFGSSARICKACLALISLFIVMASMVWATNTVQYTPFATIDHKILAFERYLHINELSLIAWTSGHSQFKQLLEIIYNSLTLQMTLFPLLIIFMEKYDSLEYYLKGLIVTTLIGFTIYYFCPTTAPSSMMQPTFFNESQLATGVKFYQIHHHINPTTSEGGMIAFPSFHVIWAWYTLYLIKEWRVLFLIMLPINTLLVLSCVLLGWHYVLDVVASIILVFIIHQVFNPSLFTSFRPQRGSAF